MFLSPLEQYIITSNSNLWVTFNIFSNISFTLLILIILLYFSVSILFNNTTFIPNKWVVFFESLIDFVFSFLNTNISLKVKKKYFPIITIVFFFLFCVNTYGMVPYTFTLSSQLIITFIFSSSIFLGIKIIAARRHNLKLFSIFFPSGLSIYLGLILIPIEFISFFFKPISLSTRLFANMVAGHTLLKVIAGFILILANQIGILYFSQFILIFIIFIVMFLELMVGVIQACVFSILCCIYINEILQLH